MCPEHPRNPKENSNSWIVVTDLLQWSNNRKSFCFLPEWSYLVLHTKTCVHSIQLYKASKVKNILFRLLLMIFSSINFLSFNRPDIKVFIFIVYVSQKSKISFIFWYFGTGCNVTFTGFISSVDICTVFVSRFFVWYLLSLFFIYSSVCSSVSGQNINEFLLFKTHISQFPNSLNYFLATIQPNFKKDQLLHRH